MSETMIPMPIEQLAKWVWAEYETQASIFGVHRLYHAPRNNENQPETPIGPAAGPHTQLAQNLIAAYAAGARFFELKTVQVMDGEAMAACIAKPCIEATEEGYNVEWSTELYVEEALNEYIKAWFVISMIAKEFSLGSRDGFRFNMSVGYDLEGIQSEKINHFIESLKDASQTAEFKRCREYFLSCEASYTHVTAEYIETISPVICNSVTLSTLHGCPSAEIERIACYLMKGKGLDTYVKCNPTLLGYTYVRETMDSMGYDYLAFDDFHFQEDLQYEDAVPMLKRLMQTGKEAGLEFGVKLTNTFPVKIKRGELPGEEMYLSGRPLFLLSFALAAKLAGDFEGKLHMSFSGGADYYNVRDIVSCGIRPVTAATTLLKLGGYQRLTQMAEETEQVQTMNGLVDAKQAAVLLKQALADPHYKKPKKAAPSKKLKRKVPLFDCFVSPCQEECPIHQDITAYMDLVHRGQYKEALTVIMEKNPLPFITGTICYHRCMDQCVRNHYESPVEIRQAKWMAAEKGCADFLSSLQKTELRYEKKAAVIGGGPAGLAAAYFLSRAGMKTTVFEQREQLGGALRFALPRTRITGEVIDQDIELIRAVGQHIEWNISAKVESIEALRNQGYEYMIIAVGAYRLEAPLKKHGGEFLRINGVRMTDKKVVTNQPGVYVAGDLLRGPASVVEAIRDARMAADDILAQEARIPVDRAATECMADTKDRSGQYQGRGVLKAAPRAGVPDDRCLHCAAACEICTEVCPNRANVAIRVPGTSKHQILHLDALCNACGNCRSFCPYDSAPYLDKFTLFRKEEDMADSQNDGFFISNQENISCKVRYQGHMLNWPSDNGTVPENLQRLMQAVCDSYLYLVR